ncbi:MADS-box transcription factor family protein [Medicago truncatula]|uniref:MADS-box transcription factor family protein n=1 Tax=Medicago truncatula TaxID=3880 RepID=A0A072V2S9_MEDTR|nr:MADS-box transcription factor family protein [Medicago truncatula]
MASYGWKQHKAKPSNKRRDTFSKRKLGLFNKVTELSILCNAKTALIITSPNKNLHACGYPNHDTVIKHFFDKENPVINTEKGKQDEYTIETSRLQHETIQERLKEEKNNLQAVKETNNSSSCLPSWWDHSIDDMALESLKQFKTSLKKLKLNLDASLQGKEIHMNSCSSSTSNII